VPDQRGQLLRSALGFVSLPIPSYDRAPLALRTRLNSCAGIGRIDTRAAAFSITAIPAHHCVDGQQGGRES